VKECEDGRHVVPGGAERGSAEGQALVTKTRASPARRRGRCPHQNSAPQRCSLSFTGIRRRHYGRPAHGQGQKSMNHDPCAERGLCTAICLLANARYGAQYVGTICPPPHHKSVCGCPHTCTVVVWLSTTLTYGGYTNYKDNPNSGSPSLLSLSTLQGLHNLNSSQWSASPVFIQRGPEGSLCLRATLPVGEWLLTVLTSNGHGWGCTYQRDAQQPADALAAGAGTRPGGRPLPSRQRA
jgi:hypothetical protein